MMISMYLTDPRLFTLLDFHRIKKRIKEKESIGGALTGVKVLDDSTTFIY